MSLLRAFWMSWTKSAMPQCECGNLATRSGQCKRCEFLDGPLEAGRNRMIPEIISTLRLHDSLPCQAIAEEVKAAPETALRTLQRMTKQGRVKRYWEEFTAPERVVNVTGKKRASYSRRQIDTA